MVPRNHCSVAGKVNENRLSCFLAIDGLLQGEEEEEEGDADTAKVPPRPSASECLKFPFMRGANKALAAGEEADRWSNAFGVWKAISGKLFDLEASIVSQVRPCKP